MTDIRTKTAEVTVAFTLPLNYFTRPGSYVYDALRSQFASDERFLYRIVSETEPVPDGPKANREKLIELLAWATAEDVKARHGMDSAWKQDHWFTRRPGGPSHWCGTAACIAGKTALEAGYQPVFAYDSDRVTGAVRKPGSDVNEEVSEVARRELGLTDYQADRLFSGGNKLEDIQRIIEQILAEAEVPQSAQQAAESDGTVTLELSQEEARAIMTVTRLVGGPPRETARRYVSDVMRKLTAAGIWQRNYFRTDGQIVATGPLEDDGVPF